MSDSYKSLSVLFEDQNLLTHALTHRSWVNEHPGKRTSNERLEFLGDAILEFLSSKDLFKMFPDKEEGYLTVLRANIVNTQSLARAAIVLEIGQHLHLSKGEEDTGGRTNTTLLADTFEAIIGALYLDGGLVKAEKFIKEHLMNSLDEILLLPLKDPKSRLQELVQSKGSPAPYYDVVEEQGPDHSKEFTIAVVIQGKHIAKATGKSKSEAAQKAAEAALAKLSEKKSAA
jgi:ribonuclease III